MPTYHVKRDVGATLVGSAYHGEMELYERLKAARTGAKLTQQQVADHFRIARVSVTQWENGVSRPDQAKFADLADLYNVSLAWLMDERGTGPQQPEAKRDSGPSPSKFIRNRSFKFYVRDWREFMGVKPEEAARAAGLDATQYEAFEHFPINFNLQQVVALADVIGVRGDQFWFPPPARPAQVAPSVKAPRKVSVRGRK